MVFRRGCLLQHREEDVEHRKQGEGAVNVSLTSPSFWVEGEGSDVIKAL